MKSRVITVLFLFITVLLYGFSNITKHDDLHPRYLRCENLINPLGIDVTSPWLSWYSESQEREQIQTAYRILVASSKKKLNLDEGDLWDSKKVLSDQSINILYKGKKLTSGLKCFWKVKLWDVNGNVSEWSQTAKWSMGLLNKSDWKADWIGLDKLTNCDSLHLGANCLPARMLRKQFDVKKKIKSATAYICGLGLFELYFNGTKIGNQVLVPALSEYPKRSFYLTFDVAKDIVKGENAIGVILGNGRFFAPRQSGITKPRTFGFPKLLFRLDIKYSDNTSESIVSDTTWKITADGPIISNNEYDGEEYDARKEMPEWDKAGFNDSKWRKAENVSCPSINISTQMIAPIKIVQVMKPKSIKEINPDKYIYDMGQNMVGWVSLKINAKKGQRIKLRFAETLKPDGNLDVANLRSAKQTDIYIANGKGVEQWEPRFTYHGFRYVELTGFPGKPNLNTIRGKVVSDGLRTIGSFICSNQILNKIYNAAYWSTRGNYRSIPTDCPQRDERQGWLGDRAMESYGESFVFDNDMFYANWMTDIADAQKASGSLPDVAPAYWPVYTDNITWPSLIITIPDNLYRQFGDILVIAQNYNIMKKWLYYMSDKYMKNYLLPRDQYGDWGMPPKIRNITHAKDPKRITPGDFLGSAYFYHCLKLMEYNANLLDKKNDEISFLNLADSVRKAINKTYLNKDSLFYANNTVTANALALSFDIPSKEIRNKVFNNLLYKTIHDYKGHTSVGLVGEQWLMCTITNNGDPELAFKIATNKDYPSWGYMIENGATTIWELWNGNTAPPSMNSHNHVMLLGDLMIWYYEDLAGIKSDPDNPAFKHIIMKPYPLGNLKFVKASYLSMYGPIKSEWHFKRNKFNWKVSIPANTTATIYIPSERERGITENGKDIFNVDGIKFVKFDKGRAVFQIGSGNYQFSSLCKYIIEN